MVDCVVPFARGPSNNRVQMKIELSEHKLVTKVSRISVEISASVLGEVYGYRDGLRKYKQLESAGEEESGNKQATGATPQG